VIGTAQHLQAGTAAFVAEINQPVCASSSCLQRFHRRRLGAVNVRGVESVARPPRRHASRPIMADAGGGGSRGIQALTTEQLDFLQKLQAAKAIIGGREDSPAAAAAEVSCVWHAGHARTCGLHSSNVPACARVRCAARAGFWLDCEAACLSTGNTPRTRLGARLCPLAIAHKGTRARAATCTCGGRGCTIQRCLRSPGAQPLCQLRRRRRA